MSTLRYKSFAEVDALAVDECTIHSASDGTSRWWQMWFHVLRDSDGQPDTFVVRIAPNAGPSEANGSKTWGFVDLGGGEWQISPSINVLVTREIHPGQHEIIGSLWHQTPKVIDVPAGERWIPGK